jgi:colanic acid/amylovoran biosynthesis glycosyltransferase
MRTTKSLRLAYLIPVFPVLSETFIIEQIKGMVERGHRVDIFVPAWRGLESLSPQLEYLDLEHRRRSIPVPKGRIARFVSAA